MAFLSTSRFSKYRIMWLLVAFDLPTDTKKDRRNAQQFRKYLLKDGFRLYQFSIYARPCSSRENMQVHIKRIEKKLPPAGKVSIFHFTDAQFEKTRIFYGKKQEKTANAPKQLTIF